MNKHIKDSKFLSLLLRHKPEELNLTIDNEGWVKVDQIIKNSNHRFTKKKLTEIVVNDDKNRYEFDGIHKNKIRAIQGHSNNNVDITFEKVSPPNILFHGTSKTNYKKILESREIKPMSRQYVHLSKDYKTAEKVAKRHDKNDYVVIKIDSYLMDEDEFDFYVSKNDVFLIERVPVQYFIFE